MRAKCENGPQRTRRLPSRLRSERAYVYPSSLASPLEKLNVASCREINIAFLANFISRPRLPLFPVSVFSASKYAPVHIYCSLRVHFSPDSCTIRVAPRLFHLSRFEQDPFDEKERERKRRKMERSTHLSLFIAALWPSYRGEFVRFTSFVLE